MKMHAAGGPGLTQKRNIVTEIPGPKSKELMARRNNAVSTGVSSTLPIYVQAAGDGVILDVDGNTFIDLGAGIAVVNVGNSAPHVVSEVQDQVTAFTHTCFMIAPYEGYVEVCEELNALTPGKFAKKSALFNSGAEAVENAVKIARVFTKRDAIVVFEHGYHGRTNMTMAMTAKSMPYKHGFGPFAGEVYRVPVAYPFRDSRSGAEVAAAAILKIEKEVGADNVAAIVIEPIQGEGGFIAPTIGFLTAIRDFAKQKGIVFVADEIQTGFCRTGQWFASEHENLEPDLITTAKGIAGGLPLAGVTGRAEIMDSVHPSGLGGTYGGNPVACAAAIGAIRTMKEMDLNARALKIEKLMVDRLKKMQSKFNVIGEIRGRGAMIAIEMIKPGSLEPNSEITTTVAKGCHSEGVLVLTAGTYGNVIRFLPPLTMNDELISEGLDVVEAQFAKALKA
ncbi:MAG: 4-aminobutyrate--2-oxoglutarate transaminase [Actinobacteria bacterium]|nr:4-aminobutyrate--2-oxoglutarate transaminase [Actinomycetota bacterium]